MLIRDAKRYVKNWAVGGFDIDINTVLYYENVIYDVDLGKTTAGTVYGDIKRWSTV